jgi:hypothetical protein
MATSCEWQVFLRHLATVVAAGVLAAVAAVVLLDPYGLYQVFDRPGINAVKPGLLRHAEEIKLTRAAKSNADAFILGNSRAEIGFDPESPALTRRAYSAYNLAIPGTSIAVARRQMEYLLGKGIKPKAIVLGIEFIDFMEDSPPAANAPAVQEDASFPVERWFWRFDSLFSMASVKDAITTLLIQSNPEAATVTSRGFNPLREYQALARNEGYYALFQQRAQESSKAFLKKKEGVLYVADLRHLRKILELSSESGGEAILIIYPYHAKIMALFEETELWGAFEDWKKLVLAEVSAARKRHPDARITLADFSGYGIYQCERIPEKGDRKTTTRWYWEAGHFKKELGDIVLEKALSLSAAAPVEGGAEPVFGMWLDENSADQNRWRIARERAECANAYPQLFADAKAIVLSARRQ